MTAEKITATTEEITNIVIATMAFDGRTEVTSEGQIVKVPVAVIKKVVKTGIGMSLKKGPTMEVVVIFKVL